MGSCDGKRCYEVLFGDATERLFAQGGVAVEALLGGAAGRTFWEALPGEFPGGLSGKPGREFVLGTRAGKHCLEVLMGGAAWRQRARVVHVDLRVTSDRVAPCSAHALAIYRCVRCQ